MNSDKLDPFTKKILDRTRTRQQQLSQMEHELSSNPSQKRGQNIFSENATNRIFEAFSAEDVPFHEFPKRRCSVSPKGKTETVLEEEKENAALAQASPQQIQRNIKILDSNTEGMDIGDDCHAATAEVCHATASSPLKTPSGVKGRLAHLASNINNWEDDATYRFPLSRFETKSSQSKQSDRPGTSVSSTNQVSLSPCKNMSGKDARFNDNGKHDVRRNVNSVNALVSTNACRFQEESLAGTTNISDSIVVSSHFPQGNNGMVLPGKGQFKADSAKEDGTSQSSLNQQEAQGFMKSPSASKLTYKYVRPLGKVKEAAEKFNQAIEEILQEEPEPFSPARNPSETATKKICSKPLDVAPKMAEKPQNVDPALLSLSDRRALFEQKMGFKGKGQGKDEPEKLAVSEKAALFEKAAKHSSSRSAKKWNEVRSPKGPVMRITETAKPQACLKPAIPIEIPTISQQSESNPPLSPSHPVGKSIRQYQEQLIKVTQNDWRDKEMVSKSLEERKREMAALRNRWEKASSAETSHADSQDQFPNSREEPQSSSTGKEYDNNEVVEACSEESEEEIDDNKEDESECDTSSDWKNYTTAKDNEPENMDEFLDEAFGDIDNYAKPSCSTTTIYPEIPDQVTMFPKESPVCPSDLSPTKKGLYPNLDDVKETIVPKSSASGSTPLMHTISMYRKQKQALSVTPVKTIIRREPVSPSSHHQSPDTTHHTQERIRELQQEAQAQQIVIGQTSQALSLCQTSEEFHGSKEQLECERVLLVASLKRQAALNEIEMLKTDGGLGNCNPLDISNGTMTLSDITLPLKLAFMEARMTGQLGNHVHYFIAIVRHKAQVVSTQMMSTDDECVKTGVLSFTNFITMQGLQNNFEVSFDVYALQTVKQKVPCKKHKKNKKHVSKALASPSVNSPAKPCPVKTTSFGLVGSLRLTISNCNRTTFNLDKVPSMSPLEGTVRVRVQIRTESKVQRKGFLTMFEDVSGYGSWFRRWCVLSGNELSFWKYPDDEKTKSPIGSIELKQCVTPEVGLVPRDICARPHTLYLLTFNSSNKNNRDTLVSKNFNSFVCVKHLLAADTVEERKDWCRKLNEALQHLRQWDPTALRPLEPAELEHYMHA